MLRAMTAFFRGPEAADAVETEQNAMATGDRENQPNASEPTPAAPPPKPADELTSLLQAVRGQAVALRVEQERSAAAAKLELETLTARMTTLAPLFAKAVERNAANERAVSRLTRSEIELARKLADAEQEVSRYRPLAIGLEDQLRIERAKVAEGARQIADLEARHAKGQRRIDDLVHQVAIAELEAQRTTEANAAQAQQAYENEFTIETITREAAELKSQITALTSDVERQTAGIAELTDKLASERDAASRAQMKLAAVQADYDVLQTNADRQAKEFEGRERRAHETVAQRDWQIHDYETRHAAQESKIEFLSRKNEMQREDIIRHLAHIAKLESTNRHMLDTLSRNAISIDDTAPEAERGKVSPPKLRAVRDE